MPVSPFFSTLPDRLRRTLSDPSFFFGLLFCVIVLTATIIPRSLSFLPSVCGVIGIIYLWVQTKKWIASDRREVFFLGGISALATLSSLWSLDPAFCFEKGLMIGLILMTGLLFLSSLRSIDFTPHLYLPVLLAMPLAIGGLIVAYEHMNGFPVLQWVTDRLPNDPWLTNRYNRTEVFLAVSFIPVLWLVLHSALHKKMKLPLALFLCAGVGSALWHANSQTAQLCFLVGIAAYLLWYPGQKILWAFCAVLLSGLILLAPWLAIYAYQWVPDQLEHGTIFQIASIPHRLVIWHFVATEALQHPWIGNGLEAVRFLASDEPMKFVNSTHVLHPHNSVLQIWVEFGALGAILLTGFTVMIWRKIGQAPRTHQKLLVSVFAGCGALSLTGFGFWQSYQLGLFLYAASLCLLCLRTRPLSS